MDELEKENPSTHGANKPILRTPTGQFAKGTGLANPNLPCFVQTPKMFRQAIYDSTTKEEMVAIWKRLKDLALSCDDEDIALRAIDLAFKYAGIKPPEKIDIRAESFTHINPMLLDDSIDRMAIVATILQARKAAIEPKPVLQLDNMTITDPEPKV